MMSKKLKEPERNYTEEEYKEALDIQEKILDGETVTKEKAEFAMRCTKKYTKKMLNKLKNEYTKDETIPLPQRNIK